MIPTYAWTTSLVLLKTAPLAGTIEQLLVLLCFIVWTDDLQCVPQVNGDEQQRILGTTFKNVAGEAIFFLVLQSVIRDAVKPVGTIVY